MEPELHVDDVARAAERLAGIANITPELTSRTLDERFDAHLRLKAECFQRTGSFKEICAIVENDFAEQLNWKLESDLKKTPVWKSSVRKILFSNSRFCPTVMDPNLFTFVAGAS